MFRPDFQLILENDKNNLKYISFYHVDELMEKLKLLNYERFLKEMRMKPLNRYYFIKSFNPGEQFFMFTSLCAWLIRKIGRDFEQPQEFHDPSATIGKIVKILQEMDISTDFPTNKLMQGAGFICIFILDCLATVAIKVNRSPLILNPEIKTDDEITTEMLDNDNEIILEKFDEEQNALYNVECGDNNDDGDSEVEHTPNQIDLKFKATPALKFSKQLSVSGDYRADTLIDSENWRLEFEKALPQLKVVVKSDPRDWRAHYEQMKIYRANINGTNEDTQVQLRKLQNDITFAMEKIESREKHLNNDLKNLIQQYKSVSIECEQIRNALKDVDADKLDTEQNLEKIIHELDNTKIQMEQQGNKMSDGSPLLNIKKAIALIKDEIIQMELEIGVMMHTIDQEILKQNALFTGLDPNVGVF